jgi:acyl-CoA reductase-like NAD-dependent aldehyde dehydrogenase
MDSFSRVHCPEHIMSSEIVVSFGTPSTEVKVDTRHFIGGERLEGNGRTFEVFSPIDGQVLGTVSAGGSEEVEGAVAAARAAFPAWAALGPDGRGEILDRFAEGILARKEALSIVETTDNGSLLIANQKRIVDRAAHNVSFFSKLARTLRPAVIDGHVVDNHVRHEPSGVAALITPWNAPLMLSTWKLGPALAAGNTVVVKPPEWAPLSCSLLADIAAASGVPPGVLNVVQGLGGEAGQALIEHPDVDRISFTGSIATGRRVAAAAAQNVTPVSLELGGKSPFIVFADADLDEAAETVAAQFANAGQVCLAGTRLLVEASVEEDFRRRVSKASEAYTVGDPRVRGVRVGPLIHPRQLERVSAFVERAVAAGARPLMGGAPHARGGLYYQPTILLGATQDSEIVQNEVFGPVLTWQTFEREGEAVELANGTEYGLSATLYTSDAARAERVAAAVVAGTVWVNCHFVRDLDAPFGGARNSGIGREGGAFSFDFFCDVKNVAIKRPAGPQKKEPNRG